MQPNDSPASTVSIEVLLFAGARDAVGTNCIRLSLPIPSNMAQLKAKLCQEFPALTVFVDYGRFACGHDFVDDEFLLDASSIAKEIALIPPVSGG